MSTNVAAIIVALSVCAWVFMYLWIRKAADGNVLLARFACSLILPILGYGLVSVALRGRASYPALVLDAAAALLTLVALRRVTSRRT